MADHLAQSSSQLTNNPLVRVTQNQLDEYHDEGGNPYKKRYVIHRIELEDLYVSDSEAMGVMQAIGNNQNSVVIGNAILLKCSSVTAVEPRWANDNPPPRPESELSTVWSDELKGPVREQTSQSKQAQMYWDAVFGGQHVSNETK